MSGESDSSESVYGDDTEFLSPKGKVFSEGSGQSDGPSYRVETSFRLSASTETPEQLSRASFFPSTSKSKFVNFRRRRPQVKPVQKPLATIVLESEARQAKQQREMASDDERGSQDGGDGGGRRLEAGGQGDAGEGERQREGQRRAGSPPPHSSKRKRMTLSRGAKVIPEEDKVIEIKLRLRQSEAEKKDALAQR